MKKVAVSILILSVLSLLIYIGIVYNNNQNQHVKVPYNEQYQDSVINSKLDSTAKEVNALKLEVKKKKCPAKKKHKKTIIKDTLKLNNNAQN